jgi:hypothetical protein
MNLKKIKLNLAIDLLNQRSNNNLLSTTRDLMGNFAEEVGAFMSQKLTKARATGDLVKESYALQYEKCTLDLDVVVNKNNSNQYIYSFDFR